MKIQKYNLFLESKNQYSIYDFFEDIKKTRWGHNISYNMEENINRFIGNGYYKILNDKISKMSNSLSKVNIAEINDRMLDIYDEFPSDMNRTSLCVIHDNASMLFKNISNTDVIIDMTQEIISPTLYVGHPSVELRLTNEERYVTNSQFQCLNFNIENFKIYKDFDGFIDSKVIRSGLVSKYNLEKKKKYNLDQIIESYKPGIYIKIGDNSKKEINLNILQNKLEDVVPAILSDLDYEEVIWDWNSNEDPILKKKGTTKTIYGYTLKILLNI